MNLFFAAGIFENPWVIAVILIGSALANWLAQRSQHKKEELEKQGRSDTPDAPGKPSGDFDMEETLRRLLGEKPGPPAAPPSIPRAMPPPIKSPGTEDDETYVQLPPVLAHPPIVPVSPAAKAIAPARLMEAAARQYEAQGAPAGRTAVVVGRGPARHSRAQTRPGWNWSSPGSARQAFVASLVFSPPKGLEP
jgi:hypothetical protein